MYTSSSTTDAISNSTSSLAAPLARLRARGFDAACSLEEKLQQLHQPSQQTNPDGVVLAAGGGASSAGVGGASSTLEHLWRLGKHFALVSSASIDDTTDKEYDRRLKATTNSKSLLLQIEREFDLVGKAVGRLTTHYDNLLDLLEKFRLVCDGELFNSYAKQKQQLDTEMQALQRDSTDFHNQQQHQQHREPSPPESGSTTSGAQFGKSEADAKLESLRARLRESAQTLQEAVKSSCSPMNLVTRTHLDDTQSKVVSRVTKMQTDYDLLRHQITAGGFSTTTPTSTTQQQQQQPTDGGGGVSGGARAALSAIVTHNPLSLMFGALSGQQNNTGRALGADGEAGFSVDEEGNTIITRPAGVAGGLGVSSTDSNSYTSTAVSKVNMNSAVPLSAREDLVAANIAYESELQQAKEILNDALEQTSMSTWSCYNVFFSQMAHYFSDVQVGNTELAKCLISLKNSQQISKKLTKERRDRLVSMRSTAECQLLQDVFERDTLANPSPPAHTVTATASKTTAGTTSRHHDVAVQPTHQQQQQPSPSNKVSANMSNNDADFFGDMFTSSTSKSAPAATTSVASPPQSQPPQRHVPDTQPQGNEDDDDEYGDFTSTPAANSMPQQQATRPTYVPSDLDNLFGP